MIGNLLKRIINSNILRMIMFFTIISLSSTSVIAQQAYTLTEDNTFYKIKRTTEKKVQLGSCWGVLLNERPQCITIPLDGRIYVKSKNPVTANEWLFTKVVGKIANDKYWYVAFDHVIQKALKKNNNIKISQLSDELYSIQIPEEYEFGTEYALIHYPKDAPKKKACMTFHFTVGGEEGVQAMNATQLEKAIQSLTMPQQVQGNVYIVSNDNNAQHSDKPISNESNEIESDVDIDIPFVKPTINNIFALIIANENYNKVAPVPFAVRDGQIINEYLNKTLGIDKGHISLLENATLNDMRYELNRLKKISDTYKGDASFIVYYIGHGIPDEKNGNGYLLPVDGFGNDVSTAYSLDDLYSQLGNLNSKKTILITDACFSGANKSGDMLVAARGVAMRAKSNQASGNLIAFSACQGDETAYSYDEKGHGLLTYYFLKKLQETQGKTTLGELEEYIVDNVGKTAIVINGKSQTPKVSVSPELKDIWRNQTLVE